MMRDFAMQTGAIKMGKLSFFLACAVVLLSPISTHALQTERLPRARSAALSSPLFRSVKSRDAKGSVVWMQQLKDNPTTRPVWRRALLGQFSPASSSNKRTRFQFRTNNRVRIRCKAILQKMAALVLALAIVFSPGPRAAHATVDYFAPPAHARVVARESQTAVIQEPETLTEGTIQGGEVTPIETASEQEETPMEIIPSQPEAIAEAIAPKKAASFAGPDAARMVMDRVAKGNAADKLVAVPQEAPAAATAVVAQIPEPKPGHPVVAASFVAAAVLGGTLGIRLSAGSVGGYSSYWPPELGGDDDDDDPGDWPDTPVGGYSYEPSPSDDSGGGDFVGGDGGSGGGKVSAVSKSEESPASPPSESQPETEAHGSIQVGTISSPNRINGEQEEYHNLGFETFSSISGYKIGYPHEDDDEMDGGLGFGFGTFSKFKPDPSTIQEIEIAHGLNGDVKDGFAGTFSKHKPTVVPSKKDESKLERTGLGLFGGEAGSFSQHYPNKEPGFGFLGGAGTFSQHKPKLGEDADLHLNRGFETFSAISGYEIGYDHEDDALDDEDEEMKEINGFSLGGHAGTFSQHRSSTSNEKTGGLKLGGGAGTFSQTLPNPSTSSADADKIDNDVDLSGDESYPDEKGNGKGWFNLFGGAGSFSHHQPKQATDKAKTSAGPTPGSRLGIFGGGAGTFSQHHPRASEKSNLGEYEEVELKVETVAPEDEALLSPELNGALTSAEIEVTTLKPDTAIPSGADLERRVSLGADYAIPLQTETALLEHEGSPSPTLESSDSSKISQSANMLDTPFFDVVNGDDHDGIASSAFRIPADAIMEDIQEIEDMEKERIERMAEEANNVVVVTHLNGEFPLADKAPIEEMEEEVLLHSTDALLQNSFEASNAEDTRPIHSTQVDQKDLAHNTPNGSTGDNQHLTNSWFDEITESFSSKLHADDASLAVNGAGIQPNVLFFTTIKRDQSLDLPLQPKDIAVFAGVLPHSTNEDHAPASPQFLNAAGKIPSMALSPLLPGQRWSVANSFVQQSEPVAKAPSEPVRLIPINDAAVELTSGLLGAAFGFSVGGPILSLLGASAANYVSRDHEKGGELYDIAQMVAESTICTVNLAGAVLHTFDVDEIVLATAHKEDVQPLLRSAQGTLRAAGNVLSAAGDFNFLLVRAVLDLSDKVGLAEKASGLVSEWWQSVHEVGNNGDKENKRSTVEDKAMSFSI